MADVSLGPVVRHLRKLLGPPDEGGPTGACLLDRFARHGDESAFAELVRRHGPLVWRVCRRILRHTQQAEEAYQATFLVLARRANRVRKPASLASFLYGVAYRVARQARADALRRQSREMPPTARDVPDPGHEAAWRELEGIIVEEVHALPEKYRAPVLLCYWEGRTNEEAAAQQGWPAGTVKTRLLAARRMLHERLTRRGVSLSAGAVVALFAAEADAAPPPVAGAPPQAAALASAGVRGMAPAPARMALALLLVSGAVAVGVGVLAPRERAGRQPETSRPAPARAERVAPAEEARAEHTDLRGDPLPPQAVARLGSTRLFPFNYVCRVILSPDGERVVSTNNYVGNHLWDARTGRELPLLEELREAAVFSTRDKLVAVANQHSDLQLWDVASGEKIGGALPAAKVGGLPLRLRFREQGYCPVGLSPDGRTLVICNAEANRLVVRFCDVARGQVEEPIPLEGADKWVSEMAFSADSKTLALQCYGRDLPKGVPGGRDSHTVRIWDVQRRKQRIVSRSDTLDYCGPMALSPDGSVLATLPRRLRLWDTRTLEELPPLDKPPKYDIRGHGIAFSPDGNQLVVSDSESTLRMWDLVSRKPIRQFQGKDTEIFHAVFSADGKFLAAGDGGYITFWDVATGKPRHDILGHTAPLRSLAFSPDGKRLVSGAASPDRRALIWDPRTGKETAQLGGHEKGLSVVTYTPDGKLVASGGEDKTIRLWDAATGREVSRLETEDGFIYAMAFATDGRTISSVAGRHTGLVYQWDVATGRLLRKEKLSGGIMLAVAFSPDGGTLAIRDFPGADIRLWDVANRKQIHRLAGPDARQATLAISPDGKTLAVGDDAGSVHLWDVLSGEPRGTLDAPRDRSSYGGVESLAFSPDGRCLAAGYGFGAGYEEEGCMVRLWELASRRERFHHDRQRRLSHRRGIRSLAFSPDGTLLASGGDDHTILVWDVTGQRTTHPPRNGRLPPKEDNALWTDLADADATKAYRAMQTLFASGEQAVSLLKERLRPAAAVEQTRVERLVADLDSDRFEVRQKAAKELREIGDVAEPALRKALADRPSVEQRLRIKELLQEIDPSQSPDRLRPLRAVEVLERVGTPAARRLLETLAKGAADARLTRDAKDALGRLAGR